MVRTVGVVGHVGGVAVTGGVRMISVASVPGIASV